MEISIVGEMMTPVPGIVAEVGVITLDTMIIEMGVSDTSSSQ